MHPGTVIQMLRKFQGMSQRELAERVGVARTYLAQVESGRKTAGLQLLRAVSRELQVPVALLLIEEEDDGLDADIRRQLRGILEHVLNARSGAEADTA